MPAPYKDRPLLTGRAEVELVVEKSNGRASFVDYERGGSSSRGTVHLTLDGYSAPVSAGNFAALVQKGKYDETTWSSGYSSVVAGAGANPGVLVPIEILPMGAPPHM